MKANLTMLAYQEMPMIPKGGYAPKAGHIPGSSFADHQQRKAAGDYGSRSHHPTIYASSEAKARAIEERAAQRQETRFVRLFTGLSVACNADAIRVLGLSCDQTARATFKTWEKYGFVERAEKVGDRGQVYWQRKTDAGS